MIAYHTVSKEETENYASIGVDSFLFAFDEDACHLQEIAMKNAHKIPLVFGIDAIHGHCLNKSGTVFPSQLSLACSFNESLVYDMASVTASEVAADGIHWTFSPVFCLGRDLRWGRVDETFGEVSYTKFAYSDIKFDSKTLTLSLKLSNVGGIAGKESVLVFFRDLISSVITPIKQLIAFKKVSLEKGESKDLTFKFDKMDFSFVNVDEKRVTESGEFEIMVGGSSKDDDLTRIKFNI